MIVPVLLRVCIGCKFIDGMWRTTDNPLGLKGAAKFKDSVVIPSVLSSRAAGIDENEVAICIKEVMEGDRGRDMKMNSKKWKELAIKATNEGGTSDTNINELVAVLRSTK